MIAAITVAASVTVLSCVSANAAPPTSRDDLYGTHDIKAISKKKQKEREAQKAEEQAYIDRMKKFEEKWGNSEQHYNDTSENNFDVVTQGDYERRLRGFDNAKYTRPDNYYDYYDNPNVTINLGFGGYWGNPYWGPYYGWAGPYYSWNWGWGYPYYNDWWWNGPYWGYYPYWGSHWGPGYWPGGYWPVYSKYNRHNTVYGRPRTGGGNYNYYGSGGRGGSSSGTVSGNRYRRNTGGTYNRGNSGSYSPGRGNSGGSYNRPNTRPYDDTPVYRRPSNNTPSYTPSYGGGGHGSSSGGGRSGQGRR